MGIYLGHPGTGKPADDLGIMSGVETPKAPPAPAAGGDVPKPADAAAAAPATDSDKPAPAPAPEAAKKDDTDGKKPEKH